MGEVRIYAFAEMEAYGLLVRAGEIGLTTEARPDCHDAGNKIIELAERIKAERAVIAMER